MRGLSKLKEIAPIKVAREITKLGKLIARCGQKQMRYSISFSGFPFSIGESARPQHVIKRLLEFNLARERVPSRVIDGPINRSSHKGLPSSDREATTRQ